MKKIEELEVNIHPKKKQNGEQKTVEQYKPNSECPQCKRRPFIEEIVKDIIVKSEFLLWKA